MNNQRDRRLEHSEITPEILKQLDGLHHIGEAIQVCLHIERIALA